MVKGEKERHMEKNEKIQEDGDGEGERKEGETAIKRE
jgi:hypothetical protein